jgi:hypothetical protein
VNRLRRWEAAAVIAALLFALVPLPSRVVEALFSTRFYPAVQHVITPISNLLPIAVLDVLLVAVVIATVTILIRSVRTARRQRAWTPILATIGHIVATAALIYLAFLCLWGFNYRRVPMADRLVLSNRPSRDALVELANESVRRVNGLHDDAHAIGWDTPELRNDRLRTAFETVQLRLSDARPATPGRLKASLLGWYFRWASVDGMVDPFALEVLANPDLLPWERPFVAAHEWSHLAGYADESEANFVGWLTCLQAGAPERYSGWLYLYWQIGGELGATERARLSAQLDEGPRRDVNAIVERLRRGQLPALRKASWAVYDGYLRANRVEEGIRSYDEVVTLILRARFEDGWVPVRRRAP